MSPDKGRNGHLRTAVDVYLRDGDVRRRQRTFPYENRLPLSSNVNFSCSAFLGYCIAHWLKPSTLNTVALSRFCFVSLCSHFLVMRQHKLFFFF